MLTVIREGSLLTLDLAAPLTSLSFTTSSNQGYLMLKPAGLQAGCLKWCLLSSLMQDSPNPQALHYKPAFQAIGPELADPAFRGIPCTCTWRTELSRGLGNSIRLALSHKGTAQQSTRHFLTTQITSPPKNHCCAGF